MRITVKRTEEVPDLIFTHPSPFPTISDAGVMIYEPLTLSAMEIVDVVRRFKKDNRGVISLEISEEQMSMILDIFTWRAGIDIPVALLTDRMRDSYYSNGTLPGFLGLTWYTREE